MALDPRSFTAFERVAHDRIAEGYVEHFAPLTSFALGPLLDVAGIAAEWRVLDVATGPGLAAAAARVRGATAIGADVSPGMVALASRYRIPGGRGYRTAFPGYDLSTYRSATSA
jgi:SAM-dependent methyltransferase